MWSEKTKRSSWSADDSKSLYNIDKWAADYFTINNAGEVAITPFGQECDAQVSMMDLVKGIEERGLSMPVLLRIENILGSRIKLLHDTFQGAIDELGYQNKYRGVFPIKVNQQEQVLEAVSTFGKEYGHGLEAGSKPELIAAISMLEGRDSYLICNGYKDEEFIDLGLHACSLGFKCFFVIEMMSELDLIIERSKQLGIRPHLGVRFKLMTKATGKWMESGGESSVFGLNMSQVVDVIDKLRAHDMLDCLELLHYHIGSQIPNICDIRAGVVEACRIYEELVSEGAAMGLLDLGGGLAVDYEGTNTDSYLSRNYSLEEYCYDIVETLAHSFNKSNIPHPVIITESGRATVAYYSVLIFNILDVASFTPHPIPEQLDVDESNPVYNLMEAYKLICPKEIQACFNDALFYREQARQYFKHGQISLREQAVAEDIFRHILIKISKTISTMEKVPSIVQDIDKHLSDVYYGNFSLFQSLPDVWAIDQHFPLMPIHRLNEAPTRQAVIADITCDSDGKIDNFSSFDGNNRCIPLHELEHGEEYYLGVFLVGAYQETLGDLHNLFGDTNVVSVNINSDGSYSFVRELEGDSVEDVLSYVEYDIRSIKGRIRALAENAVKDGLITARERRTIIDRFNEGLRGYTYFEKEEER